MVSTFRTWAFSTLLLILSPFANAALEMHTVIDGVSQALVLEPNPRIQQQSDPATHYRGHIKDHPDSWVRVSQIDGEWSGLVSLRGQLYEVTALSTSPSAARSSKQQQVKTLQGSESLGTCASGLIPGRPGKSAQPKTLNFNNVLAQPATIDFPTDCVDTVDGVCLVAELSVFFDQSFRVAFPTNYESRGAEILNIVDGIYQNELGVAFNHLTMDFVNGDQFTSDVNPGEILGDMVARRSQSRIRPRDPNIRSLMHLITARDFLYEDEDGVNDSIVGLAYLPLYSAGTTPPSFIPVLCDADGFAVGTSQVLNRNGVPNAALTALVVAHEIGHNMGMEHDGEPGAVTAVACTDPTHIMFPSVVVNATGFSQCSIETAAMNISALPAVEACFDFPVDLSLVADSGNASVTDSGVTSQHIFSVGMETANGFSGSITASGSISAGDGIIQSATLAGNSCIVSGNSYQCSAPSPTVLSTLTVSFTTGFENLTLQHQVGTGQDLFDVTANNNSLTSSVQVQGLGLAPTNLTLDNDRGRNAIVLRWQDHATDEIGYQVEHRIGGGGWSVLKNDLPVDAREYVDSASRLVGLNAYRVRAVFASSTSDPSNEATIEFTSNRLQDRGSSGGGGGGGSLSWLSVGGLLLLLWSRQRKPVLIKTCTR